MTRVGAAGLLLGAWLLSAACGGRSAGRAEDDDSPAPATCAAMDAKSSGDECTSIDGYAYDGRICVPVVCGCVGLECQRLFPTIDACDRAYAGCYADAGVDRSCVEHADCELVSRRCCAPCQTPTHDELFAVRKGTTAASVCWGDPGEACRHCAGPANPSIYAACVEGTCQLLDVSAHTSCQTSADCRISTKDCCECNGDFSDDGKIAVNGSFRAPDYCSADLSCPECASPSDPAETALCDLDRHVCGILSFHIK